MLTKRGGLYRYMNPQRHWIYREIVGQLLLRFKLNRIRNFYTVVDLSKFSKCLENVILRSGIRGCRISTKL